MAKSKFYLKEPKSSQDTPIIFFFSYGGQRLKYYTSESIHPSMWNAKQQAPRNPGNSSVLSNLAIRLNRIRSAAEEEYSRLLLMKETPTHDRIRQSIDTALGKITTSETDNSLIKYAEEFIKVRSQSTKFSKNTIKVYNTCLRHLRAYCPASFSMDNITSSFFEDFVQYLEKQKNDQNDNFFTKNYVNKLAATLRTIVMDAVRKNRCPPLPFKVGTIIPSKDDPDKIYLTKDEVKRLYALDLRGLQKQGGSLYSGDDLHQLEVARDLFLVACFTGLRFSDFSQIRPGNVVVTDGITHLRIRTRKVDKVIYVPLNEMAREIILTKYNSKLPEAMSNQKFNGHLKKLGKLAGITEKVVVSRVEGGRPVVRELSKWELIVSHTGRRSFATNAYLSDVDIETIRALGGWEDIETLRKYIRADNLDHMKKAANHKHFKDY